MEIEELIIGLPESDKVKIENWTFPRKALYALTKKYGDFENIPRDLLDNVQSMHLDLFKADTKKAFKEKIVSGPKIEVSNIAFEPANSTFDKFCKLNYESLWDIYPKRLNPLEGKNKGIDMARRRIRNKQQFDEAVRIINNYAYYVTVQFPGEEQKFTMGMANFLSKIEEFSALPARGDSKMLLPKQKIQKPWLPPLRPAYPWEASPGDNQDVRKSKSELSSSLSYEQKKEIEESLKKEAGYYDQENTKWWYTV